MRCARHEEMRCARHEEICHIKTDDVRDMKRYATSRQMPHQEISDVKRYVTQVLVLVPLDSAPTCTLMPISQCCKCRGITTPRRLRNCGRDNADHLLMLRHPRARWVKCYCVCACADGRRHEVLPCLPRSVSSI